MSRISLKKGFGLEMKENEDVVNMNFFKKVWYSIIKFEKYPTMATEGVLRAIKYLITMVIIITTITLFGALLQMHKTINSLAEYIKQNIPDFTVNGGVIEMNIEQPIVINDIQYTGIDKIVVNPLAEGEEQKEKYKNEETIVGTTIFFFNDEIILKRKINEDKNAEQKYTYNEFISNYTKEDITTFNKTELVEYLTSQRMSQFYINYGVSIFLYMLFINIVYALIDALEIGVLGWITASLARIRIRFVAIYNMAIYSLTLPMILNALYIAVNCFMSFKITYFQVAYITIAYIYMATTIFILKDDLIKKMQEVDKIEHEQKNIREEIKKQEENKKEPEENDDHKENDKKEDGGDEEPQGSEA